MKTLLLLFVLTFLTTQSFSQKKDGTYDWGFGIKYQPAAISVKKYFKQGDAAEFLFSKFDEGYRATFLLELCPALDFPKHSFRAVLGPGVHTSFREEKYVIRHESKVAFGVDGILGFEWKIPKMPVAIQVDYQPSIDFIGNDEAYKDWGGATIRIAF